MEKQIRIKIPKTKKYIYGKLRGSLKKPVVVIVHGLTGLMDESQHVLAADYFEQHGYSSLRFNLYSWEDGARRLVDSTLKTHAIDLDLVVKYLRRQDVKKIFVVGHSYGGPTVLLSREKGFQAAVLWDPSHCKGANVFKRARYVKELDKYLIGSGVVSLVGKKMVQESKDLAWDKLGNNFDIPTKIILAADGILHEGGNMYKKQIKGPVKLVTIKGADHCFRNYGIGDKLYKETLKWFDKYK